MERWSGRVAVVTGCSSGIGEAIAKLLVCKGMRVVGIARREERVQNLAQILKAENAKGELHALKCDVTKEDEIKQAIQWTKANLGGVDVLVNNAGRAEFAKLSEISTEQIHNMLDLNVVGLSIFTREVVQDMRSRGVDDGHIFHINSVLGHTMIDFPGMELYTATKHAVTVLTEGLRRELRDLKTKIRVTSISPGCTRSEFAIAGGFSEQAAAEMYNTTPTLEPEDVAEGLFYALGTPPHVQVHEIIIHPTGEGFTA